MDAVACNMHSFLLHLCRNLRSAPSIPFSRSYLIPSSTFSCSSLLVALLEIMSRSMFLYHTEIQIPLWIEMVKSSSFLGYVSSASSSSCDIHSTSMLFLLQSLCWCFLSKLQDTYYSLFSIIVHFFCSNIYWQLLIEDLHLCFLCNAV